MTALADDPDTPLPERSRSLRTFMAGLTATCAATSAMNALKGIG